MKWAMNAANRVALAAPQNKGLDMLTCDRAKLRLALAASQNRGLDM